MVVRVRVFASGRDRYAAMPLARRAERVPHAPERRGSNLLSLVEHGHSLAQLVHLLLLRTLGFGELGRIGRAGRRRVRSSSRAADVEKDEVTRY